MLTAVMSFKNRDFIDAALKWIDESKSNALLNKVSIERIGGDEKSSAVAIGCSCGERLLSMTVWDSGEWDIEGFNLKTDESIFETNVYGKNSFREASEISPWLNKTLKHYFSKELGLL